MPATLAVSLAVYVAAVGVVVDDAVAEVRVAVRVDVLGSIAVREDLVVAFLDEVPLVKVLLVVPVSVVLVLVLVAAVLLVDGRYLLLA